jgi:hypothetical protein
MSRATHLIEVHFIVRYQPITIPHIRIPVIPRYLCSWLRGYVAAVKHLLKVDPIIGPYPKADYNVAHRSLLEWSFETNFGPTR